MTYGRSFNIDPATVDDYQRQIGKVLELGLGYQGGVGAFLTFAAVYNLDLDELAEAVWGVTDLARLKDAKGLYDWTVKKRRSTFGLSERVWIACQVLVTAWRDAHPTTVQLWADAEEAVRNAIRHDGVAFDVGQHIRVQRNGVWTRVRLPSGRALCYLRCELSDSGRISYAGVNQYTRQWARISTYGGKICENVTQAAARDVLAEAIAPIESDGYQVVLTVHDELITETPDTEEFSWKQVAARMSEPKVWAPGLPLSAAGFETDRYRKD